MAPDLASTRQKIQDALDEADKALGQVTTTDLIAQLKDQLNSMTTAYQGAKATLDKIRADLG